LRHVSAAASGRRERKHDAKERHTQPRSSSSS
jgi:hypothetical protein